MSNSMSKTMSWSEMQKHALVDESMAFYELNQSQIFCIFELDDIICDSWVIKTSITEEKNRITGSWRRSRLYFGCNCCWGECDILRPGKIQCQKSSSEYLI